MHNLNVRVAWHDNRWNGHVCQQPALNGFCLDLERIRAEREEGQDCRDIAGCHFSALDPDALPSCQAESGVFMNQKEWWRTMSHPYQDIPKAKDTHGHLRPTKITVPPYSTFAVPFWWMLRKNQSSIDLVLPNPLPPDEESPFNSPWVFSRARQEALCALFFGRLEKKRSLVFFYTKSGHPLEEAISRLVVGVGRIESISDQLSYQFVREPTYPIWDRPFTHSIRPDGYDGLLLPYHDYLDPTGDVEEDVRRRQLAKEITVIPEPVHIMSFSYVGELSTSDVALSTLVKCLEAVRRIRKHGIASGPWKQREE